MKAKVYPWRNRGLVYLAVPKAACSSIKYALLVARGLPLPDPVWRIHQSEWPEQMRFEKVRQWRAENCATLFYVHRHPVDRLLSCYQSKFHPDRIHDLRGDHPEIDLHWTLREFVEFVLTTDDETCNEHLTSQVHLLSDEDGLLDGGLRFDNLEHDWNWFIRRVKHMPSLPHLNRSDGPSIKIHPRLRKMIAERYEQDYVQFGYR